MKTTTTILTEAQLRKIKNVKNNWKKTKGKAAFIKFLSGEKLGRTEAIQAKCYECVQGEETGPCLADSCPLTQYCQWNN